MKRLIALLTAVCLMFSFAACGKTEPVAQTEIEPMKVGMVCIGDENSAYDRNFYMAANNATEILAKEGIAIEWVYVYNKPEGDEVITANTDLADTGCEIIFNNSYGQEPAMLQVAPEYPEVQFVGLTNEASTFDDLANTHNAFVRIYEGRYLAGIVAGMKLNELLANGTITEPKIGYVGAYSFAEVISGFTAYYLGAKSVCPSVTMEVVFVNSWSDATLEANAAETLLGNGCTIISQHSDNTTPATCAQNHNCFHTGYNIDMSDVAPAASLISTRIDWTNYFVYAIRAVYKGEEFSQDYCAGLAEGDVVLTALNNPIAANGTEEMLAVAKDAIVKGILKMFDTSTFTVHGAVIEQAFALDTNNDWVPDSEEAIVDGQFLESYYKSAPYFALQIDGITWIN